MSGHVTSHAATGILVRLSMESKDELLRSRDLGVVACGRLDAINVSFAGTVAAFATRTVLRVFWCRSGMNRL